MMIYYEFFGSHFTIGYKDDFVIIFSDNSIGKMDYFTNKSSMSTLASKTNN